MEQVQRSPTTTSPVGLQGIPGRRRLLEVDSPIEGQVTGSEGTSVAGEGAGAMKYVRAFLIGGSLGAQFVDDLAGALVELQEVLPLRDAHAATRVAPDAVQAVVQVPKGRGGQPIRR